MGEMLLNGRLYGASGIRELTQAQYDALPASKLTDGVLYCITDSGVTEGDKYNPVIYSLEEREIGVFVNGKPLYQKTISCGGIPNASTKTVAHDISDIDFIVSIGGSCSGYSPIKYYPIPLVQHSASLTNYQVKVEVDETNITISTAADLSPLTNSYITVQYTKTTDVPGSGTWGTDGVPMVHYDGTERIIGTWFGETLYQKSYDLGSDVSIDYTGWTEINANYPTNCNLIIQVDCTTSGGTYAAGVLLGKKSNGKFEMQTTRNGNHQSLRYFTIKYTKTT